MTRTAWNSTLPVGKPPRRRKHPNPVNWKRRRRLKEKQFGPKRDWIITLACCVCGRMTEGGNHPHHAKTRGSGGTAADLVPLCWEHHNDCHRLGYSQHQMEHDWQLSLTEAAKRYESEWRNHAD